MREIKFRVWGEREKEMFYPDNEMLTFSSRNKRINYRDVFSHFKHRYQKMLYTSLKDKNSKEIYEGDILKLWINGVLQHQYYIVEDIRKFYSKLEKTDYYSITSYEVIGNKYTDPEILEEE